MLAKVNDVELFYTLHGQGPPMLLMHGGPGLDHTYFRPWLDPLGRHVQLIFYNQRSLGCSTRPPCIADADALRAGLGYEQLFLLGHAYGGFLAQEYALRHGNRLIGLILCNSSLAPDNPEGVTANAALNRLDHITTGGLLLLNQG